MHRPILKYVVRLAVFASVVGAVACSNPTAPAAVNAKKAALRDSTDGSMCRSGYTLVNGRAVCNPDM